MLTSSFAEMVFIEHKSKTAYLEHGFCAWQSAKGLEIRSTDARICKTTPNTVFRTELEDVLVADGHTSAGSATISAQQIIAHHNATLTNMSSFGPRVQAVTADNVQIPA